MGDIAGLDAGGHARLKQATSQTRSTYLSVWVILCFDPIDPRRASA
jgi:hypothetical protein